MEYGLYQAALRVWGGSSAPYSQTMSCYTTQMRMIGTRLGWMQKENREFYSLKNDDKWLWCLELIWIFDTDIRDGYPRQQTEKTKPRLFQAVTPSSTVPPVWPPCVWTVRGTASLISNCTVKIISYYFTEESIKYFSTRRHEKYRTQYRAMFVMNCTVDKEEVLRYKTSNNRKQKRHRKKARQESTSAPAEAEMESESGLTDARLAGMDEEEMYHPVKCTECSTEVAVYDKDEVYHFFNILASYC